MASQSISHPQGVDVDKFQQSVSAAFETYLEIDKTLKERLIEYLVHGQDASCLLEIKAALQGPIKVPFFGDKHGSLTVASERNGKKLRNAFKQSNTTRGYYQRLGEFIRLHPKLKRFPIDEDQRLPDWFNAVVQAYYLLGNMNYVRSVDAELRIACYSAELTESEKDTLVEILVGVDPINYDEIGCCLTYTGDYAKFLESRLDRFRVALLNSPSAGTASTIMLMFERKFPANKVIEELVHLLLNGSKKVIEAARALVPNHLESAKPIFLKKLHEGDAKERPKAAEYLAEYYGKSALKDLKTALAEDSNAKHRQTLENLIEQFERDPSTDAVDSSEALKLAPMELPEDPIPLPPGFREGLTQLLEKEFEARQKSYNEHLAQYSAPDRPHWIRKPEAPERMPDQSVDQLCQYIEGRVSKSPALDRYLYSSFGRGTWDVLETRQLHLIQLIRVLAASRLAQLRNNELHLYTPQVVDSHRSAQEHPYGLRELDAAATKVLGQSGAVARAYFGWNHDSYDWEPSAVWPLFIEQMEIFRNTILGVATERSNYGTNQRRRIAIELATKLPVLPPEIEGTLWTVALGETKTDRPNAQRALKRLKVALPRALAALKDGRQQIRVAAAEMLAILGDASAVEPLKQALKDEKQEAVKGSLLQAIEQLGGNVDEFLGHEVQLANAKKGLSKSPPKSMSWFSLDALPQVRWAANDKPVDPEIVKWWIVQSVQFKLPSCGAILRKSLQLCRPDDAANLAKFVLAAWIGYDTQVPNAEESLAAATDRATREFKTGTWMTSHFETIELYRDFLLSQMQGQFLNSASSEKGMLAVVSAAGDKQCVRMIEKYIRTHHGHRLAQSKALLETLAWIEDPMAIQLLLSLGNRFRTAGIRKRAAEIVQELADRKGWTMEQLADRTIPDAGFVLERAEDGTIVPGRKAELTLEYGPRKFAVVLSDDLEAVITREDGKEVKSLPAAAKDDDAELVKAAKAEFTAAKKAVKEVVKIFAERLYEGACSERVWNADDWQTYLASHPIAGALCRRVVWKTIADTDDSTPAYFRPLEDGTLTDVNDDEVKLASTDKVVIAHSSAMSSEEESAWVNHLNDYEVPQLFRQFGRQTYRVEDSALSTTEIADFQGHMLSTFQLRGKATKLGWQRGSAQDGGSFGSYYKPFRSAGITAMLEFTGSYVPEQDIPAAIRSLYFIAIRGQQEEGDTYSSPAMKLGKVPAILISECYNDVRDISAEGTGFDPEWQKKGLW